MASEKQRIEALERLRASPTDRRRGWPGLLGGRIAFWGDAVVQQADRLEGRAHEWNAPFTLDVDLMFLVTATARLQRLVVLAVRSIAVCGLPDAVSDQIRADLQTALAVFEAAVGSDFKNVRDVLEHEDEYLLGVGGLQKSSAGPAWTQGPRHWSVQDDSYQLHAGPGLVADQNVLIAAGRSLRDAADKALGLAMSTPLAS